MFFSAPPALNGAACRDLPEADKSIFFPPPGTAYKRALRICKSCPVKAECLEWALTWELRDDHEFYGIYGGTTARERERLYRQP